MTSTSNTQQDRIHRERAEDVRALLAQWDDLMQSHGATDLGRVLDRFKVSQPGAASSVDTRPGPTRHLTRVAERLYAQVGERWFEVSADDEGEDTIEWSPV